MEQFTIEWTAAGERCVEGPFDDLDALRRARQRADEIQRPVRVLRLDGTPFMLVWPESATIRKVPPPKE